MVARGEALNAKVVFMFSGQGSQYFQMGHELFVKDPVFRTWMVRLDGIARELSGFSVIEALYIERRSKTENFDRTLLTHPAIFMVEYSLAQSLIGRGVVPDIVLGASLGSFAAAAVAGFVDVEDALSVVISQARVMESHCAPGGMIAILEDPALCAEEFLSAHSELAGINFSSHFVVSSPERELRHIEADLKARKLTFQRLPVSVAFHSRWIDTARKPFESLQGSVSPKIAFLEVMCCEQADFLRALSDGYFWRIVRNEIRFRETIAQLERRGSHRYIDISPNGTLATFLKYGLISRSNSTTHAILTRYGHDERNIDALMASTHRGC